MGTVTALDIAIVTPGEIVGPGSPFDKGRRALQKEMKPILEAAAKIKVENAEDAEEATKMGRLLQASQVEREKWFKSIKTQIDAVKRPVLDAEKEDVGKITSEKSRLGELLTRYNHAQEQLRIEAERKAREAAEKAAREEALARAIELELSGDTEAAEQVLDEPVEAPVVIRSTAPAHVPGQVSKKKFSVEVTSLMTLVKAVAEGKVPLQAVQANMSYLNTRASADQEAYNIPGTKATPSSSTHFRA